MDKYEFNIKVEQIKKLVAKGDFETSMKIADTIDWRRVRNANLLAMISQVYEKNEEYQEAKEVLLMAFERAPIGKRLLYKLTELALKEGSVREAEDYYREFCELAPEDPRQHLLRYMILKEKNGSDDQLIYALERYTSTELDEKWMYELAALYSKSGQQAKCVALCDRIMLMFGLGKYVDKAMELKLQYAPLSEYQMDLVENKDKYEARLKAVEQEFSTDYDEAADEEPAQQDTVEMYSSREEEAGMYAAQQENYEVEESVRLIQPEEAQPVETVEVTEVDEAEEAPQAEVETEAHRTVDEELAAHIQQAEAEKQLAEEMARMSIQDQPEEEAPAAQTKMIRDAHKITPVTAMAAKAMEVTPEEIRKAEEEAEAAAIGLKPSMANHLMIESRTPETGLQMAVDALKKIHLETGSSNPVVKISGGKLNQKGIWNVAEKLAGKDLIIEEAGDLSREELTDLQHLIAEDTTGMIVVLIDNPRQMEELHQQNPELASLFECIGSEKSSAAEPTEADFEAAVEKQIEEEEKLAKAKESPQAMPVVSDKEKTVNIEPVQRPEDDEEMGPDEFAEYACKYAAEIDCSITGKSMLALYERIEIMEEDGIPLTKANAEDLIEEAADKAEKPSLGRMIKGVFSSKYDKEGLLILREDHFI